MAQQTPTQVSWDQRMKRNTLGLAAWTAAWVASVALARFGPGALWSEQTLPSLLAIGFSVLVGIGMLLANKRHLQGLDELQRTLQLHAMGWSLGAGLVAGIAWSLLHRHRLAGVEASISHLLIFMAVTYLVALAIGLRRYL